MHTPSRGWKVPLGVCSEIPREGQREIDAHVESAYLWEVRGQVTSSPFPSTFWSVSCFPTISQKNHFFFF